MSIRMEIFRSTSESCGCVNTTCPGCCALGTAGVSVSGWCTDSLIMTSLSSGFCVVSWLVDNVYFVLSVLLSSSERYRQRARSAIDSVSGFNPIMAALCGRMAESMYLNSKTASIECIN